MLHLIRRLVYACCCILLYTPLVAQTANRNNVVIDELLPDPSPPVQLPNYEFIELRNVSRTAFNLRNWQLSDGSSTATITTSFVLQPDSLVIICANSATSAFAAYGTTIGVSNFPSLNNDADIISLYSAEGRLIHTVSYTADWYQNAVKSDGGWSLEMIDPQNPCTGARNWKASIHSNGGTPGRKNSLDGVNTDEQLPSLYRTYTTDSTTVMAVFDEPLDSASAAVAGNYTMNGLTPLTALPVTPLLSEVALHFPAPLSSAIVYELKVAGIADCSGNTIGQYNTAKAGLPTMADSQAVVINEVLFNPASDGYDYVELYNRSNNIIDCKQLYLATRNATGQLTTVTQLSAIPYLLFPGDYHVFTANRNWLQQQYLVKDTSLVSQLSLPSMPDDKGIVVLLNAQGAIVDELHYQEKWHFALLNNKEGVALERINYNQPAQEATNWTSAASTVGFGTPGYQNSQLMAAIQLQGQVTIDPPIFSPDNDGFNDYATINYTINEPGYVANIRIFDAGGRRVRFLVQNATLTTTGQFRWDGLDDNRNQLPVGIYIVATELFNLQGKSKRFKQVVTLARKR